jgi:hypothetical protein
MAFLAHNSTEGLGAQRVNLFLTIWILLFFMFIIHEQLLFQCVTHSWYFDTRNNWLVEFLIQ